MLCYMKWTGMVKAPGQKFKAYNNKRPSDIRFEIPIILSDTLTLGHLTNAQMHSKSKEKHPYPLNISIRNIFSNA